MNVVKGLYYTEDHEWVKVEGEKAYIGITDFAQHALGDIVFVELPEVDTTFSIRDSFSTVESVKAASDIYMPVSGTVLESNEAVVDDPSALNQDAYTNWLVSVSLTDKSDLDKLMNAEAYEDYCSKQ